MRKRPVAADSAAAHADELFRSRLKNQTGDGRLALPARLMAGLLYLKHAYDLSDEEVCVRWLENPY